MTNTDLTELERLLAEATPGPWGAQKPDPSEGVGVIGLIRGKDGQLCFTPTNGIVALTAMFPTELDAGDTKRAEANAALIVAAINALPSLIAAVREQEWQGIETAPKDGTEFQAWIVNSEHPDFEGHWEPQCRINPDSEAFEIWGRVDYDQDGWDCYVHLTATHWKASPAPPRNLLHRDG